MMSSVESDREDAAHESLLGYRLQHLSKIIESNFSPRARDFCRREFGLCDQLVAVSSAIRCLPKGNARKIACQSALEKICLEPGCYLPTNPGTSIEAIDPSSGTPMQSANKSPFLVNFWVRQCDFTKLEASRIEEIDVTAKMTTFDGEKISNDQKSDLYSQACIFKEGDDVRQDILALQILRIMRNIFSQFDLDLFVYPYRVISIGPEKGIIECVPNSKSRDQIGRQTNERMCDFFLSIFGGAYTPAYLLARRNFIMSMAAYSAFCYLIQVKDRHNGNIMLDKDGHLIHIDFGFMFESSPGGNIGWEPDIKLTREMWMIMGGRIDSPQYRWFEHLTVQAYLSLRPYEDAIVTLVSLMLDTGLPCFRGQTIYQLRHRFGSHLNDREASANFLKMIRNDRMHWRQDTYDWIQYVQNQITF